MKNLILKPRTFKPRSQKKPKNCSKKPKPINKHKTRKKDLSIVTIV